MATNVASGGMSSFTRPGLRGIRFSCLAFVILVGLSSRRFPAAFHPTFSRFGGDVLWAAAVVLLASIVWPALPIRRLALAGGLFSLSIELSQLFHPRWMEAVRDLPGARLILGSGFLWSDLVCYAVGIALGALLVRLSSWWAGSPGRVLI